MNLSFQRLKELVESDLTPEALAHELTFRACPVEGIEKVGDDFRIGLEVTFNRADLLSHVGVAREVAAVTGGHVAAKPVRLVEDAEVRAADLASVEVEAEARPLCPRYTARVIRGVKVGPSPAWLTARLETLGVRPVNNVVDVTNYVMFDLGQPLHAFDKATLSGSKIVVRRASAGEAFTAIDGGKHALTPEALVIADGARPVAIAGVMGGKDTEITDRTTDVLLESAYFDPISVRRTVRRLNLRSDSSYRFERGVDPSAVEAASARAAELILKVAGGALAQGVIDVDQGTLPGPRKLELRIRRIKTVTGVEIDGSEAGRHLRALGFGVMGRGDVLEVTVPTARFEVCREIDLIEEVLRAHGYDKVPLNTNFPIRVAPVSVRERAIERAKRLFVGAGFREVLTLSFVEKDDEIDPPVFTSLPALTVRNPVAPEIPALRRSLLGSLLAVKKINVEKGNRDVRLFETALAYIPRPDDQPDERLHAGFIADIDFFHAKGVVEALFHELGLKGRLAFAEGTERCFDALKQAEVRLDGAKVGAMGQVVTPPRALSPRAKDLFDAVSGRGKSGPVAALLDLEALLAAVEKGGTLARRYAPIPVLPAVTRDLAVVVAKDRYWREIADAIAGAEAPFLARFDYIQGSVFEGAEGKAVPAGKKSIAVTLEFRAPDRTLTGEEADASRERIKTALAAKLDAGFRE